MGGGVLPLCRNVVGVFCSPSRLGHRTHFGGVLPSAVMQSVYFEALVDWATGHLSEESYPSAAMQSVYSAALTDWATGHTLGGGVLSLCRNAVGVFWSPSRLGHRTLILGESYPSAEMQSVYSTVPAEWATGYSLGESYPSTEMQSVYSAAPANWVIAKKKKNKVVSGQCVASTIAEHALYTHSYMVSNI